MKMRIVTYICAAMGVLLPLHNAETQEVHDMDKAHLIHRKAYHYHMAEHYDEAIRLYKQSAAMGLAKSENNLARILYSDQNGKRDYAAALPWLIRAAAPRENSQGYGFTETQRQAKETLEWYCRRGPVAFPKSHPFSKDPRCWQGRGEILMSGKLGVKKNYVQAQALLEQAVAAGRGEARESLEQAKALNIPKPPRNYGKIAAGLAILLLFMTLMRILRWRQRLFWLVHQLHP